MQGRKSAQPSGLSGAEIVEVIHLVRDIVLKSALDCSCRERVNDALRQLEEFERQCDLGLLLAAAREERRKIGVLAEMLSDFAEDDTIDQGVVETASLIFSDIAAAAHEGSRLLRDILSIKTCN